MRSDLVQVDTEKDGHRRLFLCLLPASCSAGSLVIWAVKSVLPRPCLEQENQLNQNT